MKKGFTLLELLAVIAIISIIFLITFPKINGVIENSKMKSAEVSAINYKKSVSNQISMNLMNSSNGKQFNRGIYDLPISDDYDIQVKGNKPTKGWIEINKTGPFRYSVLIDGYTITYDGDKTTTIKGDMIADKPTFETDSWKVVIQNARNKDTYYYNIGDTKKLKFTNNIERTVRIANMSTPDECKREGFSQTACGFVVEFADKASGGGSSSTNAGGWPVSGKREYLNTTFYNIFPDELKKGIIDTYVVSGHGKNDGDDKNYVTIDKIYELTAKEVYSKNISAFTDSNFTRELDFYYEYNKGENKMPNKPRTDGIDDPWLSWGLRTPNLNIGEKTCFGHVYHDHVEYNMCQSGYASSPAFRIG